jgi:hypothetical protein
LFYNEKNDRNRSKSPFRTLHQTPRKGGPQKNGGFAKKSFRMVALDRLSEDYLFTRAIAEHKTPSEIISEMVREKVSAAAL